MYSIIITLFTLIFFLSGQRYAFEDVALDDNGALSLVLSGKNDTLNKFCLLYYCIYCVLIFVTANTSPISLSLTYKTTKLVHKYIYYISVVIFKPTF